MTHGLLLTLRKLQADARRARALRAARRELAHHSCALYDDLNIARDLDAEAEERRPPPSLTPPWHDTSSGPRP